MDSDQRRKRKQQQQGKPSLLPLRSLLLCCFCFIFLLFTSSLDRLSITSSKLRPTIAFPDVSLLTSSGVKSVKGSGMKEKEGLVSLRVEDRVLFPDHVLLFVSLSDGGVFRKDELECVYAYNHTAGERSVEDGGEDVARPVISTDEYDEIRSIVRCPVPPLQYSAVVGLRVKKQVVERLGDGHDNLVVKNESVHSWDMVAYEAMLDGETAVVFVKGLNLRPGRVSDASHISCHFGLGKLDGNETFVLTTKAVSAAQEVVRCALPRSIRNKPEKALGVRVAISVDHVYHGRIVDHIEFPSAAVISRPGEKEKQVKAKYEMCVCTMVWNQAHALREWIAYHSWLGVERWFIYDNNSDDEIKEVITELGVDEFHVSRHTWPWIKTQEAGFSHCAIRAKEECNWVGFFDVDEFFYFPVQTRHGRGINENSVPGQNSLRHLVSNYSSSETIGELRTTCHSFGPSGLKAPPPQGVTAGYTCRLHSPERHKSIVRPDALHDSLLNVVHHFLLKEGFRYKNVLQSISLINHYKYQVWEVFKAKFYRRVATYVADWQENQNEGSKDRAPGLGTEAIEPPNWHLQFCEVWDTGLRDIVLANLGDPMTGKLPWERTGYRQLA